MPATAPFPSPSTPIRPPAAGDVRLQSGSCPRGSRTKPTAGAHKASAEPKPRAHAPSPAPEPPAPTAAACFPPERTHGRTGARLRACSTPKPAAVGQAPQRSASMSQPGARAGASLYAAPDDGLGQGYAAQQAHIRRLRWQTLDVGASLRNAGELAVKAALKAATSAFGPNPAGDGWAVVPGAPSPSPPPAPHKRSLGDLEEAGRPHAAADAHGDDAHTFPPTTQLV